MSCHYESPRERSARSAYQPLVLFHLLQDNPRRIQANALRAARPEQQAKARNSSLSDPSSSSISPLIWLLCGPGLMTSAPAPDVSTLSVGGFASCGIRSFAFRPKSGRAMISCRARQDLKTRVPLRHWSMTMKPCSSGDPPVHCRSIRRRPSWMGGPTWLPD
jgi:hypothetical protein